METLAGTWTSPTQGVVGDQFLVVGVRGEHDGAGVRHRHRDGAEADHPPHRELLGEQPHRGDEPLPPQVRFQAGQQQERRAHVVVQRVQVQLGFFVAGEVVGLERHQRPAGPVVEQLVDGEGGHQFGVEGVLEVLGGEPDGVTGIREPSRAWISTGPLPSEEDSCGAGNSSSYIPL